MTAVPNWMHPPREEGWFADDLDHLPQAPRHTEVVDGALVFMMSPQRTWHARVINMLWLNLREQAPAGVEIDREMTIRLDKRNRPEPDLLATTVAVDPDRTFFTPDQVLLVVEVVSPESAHRDRTVKVRKYAEAGIAHYWRVENEESSPVVHTYELDESTRAYVATGIHRGKLRVVAPFAATIDLDGLLSAKR